MDWQTLFLKADGRIGKKDYWVGIGILFLAGFILGQLPVIKFFWPLASLYFAVCVYGKRLHDIGHSAWLVLVPFGIMVIASVLATFLGGAALLSGAATGSDGLAVVAGLAGFGLAGLVILLGGLACLGLVIWLGVQEGEATDNQFGPPRDVPLVTAI